MATRNGWTLLTSQYVILEITRNIPRLPVHAASDWAQLRSMLVLVRDVWTMDRPAVFGPAKDRPVLFTAAAWAEVLLTLDRGDFGLRSWGRVSTGWECWCPVISLSGNALPGA